MPTATRAGLGFGRAARGGGRALDGAPNGGRTSRSRCDRGPGRCHADHRRRHVGPERRARRLAVDHRRQPSDGVHGRPGHLPGRHDRARRTSRPSSARSTRSARSAGSGRCPSTASWSDRRSRRRCDGRQPAARPLPGRVDVEVPDTEAQDGAASSNLFLGFVGVDAMWGYIADWGDTNVDVGHRRWLVCPGSTQVGLGDVPAPRSGTWASNAMKVFDGPAITDGPSRDRLSSTWPNPGLVPLNYAGPYWMLDRFSLQVPTYVSTRHATVSITSEPRGPIAVSSMHTDDLAYCQPVVEWGAGGSHRLTARPGRSPCRGLTQGGARARPIHLRRALRRPERFDPVRAGRVPRLHRTCADERRSDLRDPGIDARIRWRHLCRRQGKLS